MAPTGSFKTSCIICGVKELTSQVVADAHFSGKKHLKNVAKLDLQQDGKLNWETLKEESIKTEANKSKSVDEIKTKSSMETKVKQTRKFNCEICSIDLSGPDQYKQHILGSKHLKKLNNLKECIKPQANKSKSADEIKEKSTMETKVFKSADEVKEKSPKETKFFKNLSDMIFAISQFMSSEKSESDASAGVKSEMAYFKDRKVMCGLCNSYIESTDTGKMHFKSDKHKKKALTFAKSKDLDLNKWCPICMVSITSHMMATAHYNGAQHKTKLKTCEETGTHDSSLIKRLQPENALRAHLSQAPGAKRPADDRKDEGPTLKKGHFNCLFCNVTLRSKEMLDKHRKNPQHLQNVQRRVVKKPDPYISNNPLGLGSP